MAKCAIEVSENDDSIYDRILETVDTHELSSVTSDMLLTEVYEALPTALWETRKKFIDSLNDSLRRRTSPLMYTWSQLGLPQHLHSLIQVQREPV